MQISSDALVFFGATGDLAHKKVFPALQKLAKRGNLEIPVIGVAKSGWYLPLLSPFDRMRSPVFRKTAGDQAGFSDARDSVSCSIGTGVQESSGLKSSIFLNSWRVSCPKSF